jgi:hypothetical protein
MSMGQKTCSNAAVGAHLELLRWVRALNPLSFEHVGDAEALFLLHRLLLSHTHLWSNRKHCMRTIARL